MSVEQEWLDNLAEGDLVAIDISNFGSSVYVITKITKITPTRIIKTDVDVIFNSNGLERGRSGERQKYLQPVTQKIFDHIERMELLRKIKETKFKDLSLETLRKVVDLINV